VLYQLGEAARRQIGRRALERPVHHLEGVVGLEKEVAADPDVAEPALAHVEVGDDEFSTRNLVFTVHTLHNRLGRPRLFRSAGRRGCLLLWSRRTRPGYGRSPDVN